MDFSFSVGKGIDVYIGRGTSFDFFLGCGSCEGIKLVKRDLWFLHISAAAARG